LQEKTAFFKDGKENRGCYAGGDGVAVTEFAIQQPVPQCSQADAHQEKTERVKTSDEAMELQLVCVQDCEQNSPCRAAAEEQEPENRSAQQKTVRFRWCFGLAGPDSARTHLHNAGHG